jgi:hypothetical protein
MTTVLRFEVVPERRRGARLRARRAGWCRRRGRSGGRPLRIRTLSQWSGVGSVDACTGAGADAAI